MTELRGKNALITGSSRGVGQQVAIGLGKLGCKIIIHGRTAESCKNTAAMLEKRGVEKHIVYGELSDEQQVKQLISQVKDLGISIDILYNNAALMTRYHSEIWEHSWDAWLNTFRVNVIAMYDLCGAFMPGMITNGFGRIVNLTSGIPATPELAPYGASKWAVNKLTIDLASKLENTGVRINALDPGWLKTDMGGENAEHPVEAVLPGALAPVLIDDDGPNGEFFSAIDHDLDL